MSIDRDLFAEMQALCAELHDDDGEDPRRVARSRDRQRDQINKTRRLCGQIARALDLALASLTDDRLTGLRVHSVRPGTDARHLVVEMHHPDPDPTVLEAVEATRGWLRTEAAAAIHRKRVPELVLAVTAAEEVDR